MILKLRTIIKLRTIRIQDTPALLEKFLGARKISRLQNFLGRKTSMIKSPCVKICRLESNVCVGCNRTVDEIARWSRMSDNERRAVVDRINRLSTELAASKPL